MSKIQISGYALLWNVEYNFRGFYERIAPGALKNADLTDVRLLVNHDPSRLLARTKSGTLKVTTDSVGLHFRGTLPNTELGRETAEMVQRGDLSQVSWGFFSNSAADTWERTSKGELRTINEVLQVLDVSPVTYPANPATYVTLDTPLNTLSSSPAVQTATSADKPQTVFVRAADDPLMVELNKIQNRHKKQTEMYELEQAWKRKEALWAEQEKRNWQAKNTAEKMLEYREILNRAKANYFKDNPNGVWGGVEH